MRKKRAITNHLFHTELVTGRVTVEQSEVTRLTV